MNTLLRPLLLVILLGMLFGQGTVRGEKGNELDVPPPNGPEQAPIDKAESVPQVPVAIDRVNAAQSNLAKNVNDKASRDAVTAAYNDLFLARAKLAKDVASGEYDNKPLPKLLSGLAALMQPMATPNSRRSRETSASQSQGSQPNLVLANSPPPPISVPPVASIPESAQERIGEYLRKKNIAPSKTAVQNIYEGLEKKYPSLVLRDLPSPEIVDLHQIQKVAFERTPDTANLKRSREIQSVRADDKKPTTEQAIVYKSLTINGATNDEQLQPTDSRESVEVQETNTEKTTGESVQTEGDGSLSELIDGMANDLLAAETTVIANAPKLRIKNKDKDTDKPATVRSTNAVTAAVDEIPKPAWRSVSLRQIKDLKHPFSWAGAALLVLLLGLVVSRHFKKQNVSNSLTAADVVDVAIEDPSFPNKRTNHSVTDAQMQESRFEVFYTKLDEKWNIRGQINKIDVDGYLRAGSVVNARYVSKNAEYKGNLELTTKGWIKTQDNKQKVYIVPRLVMRLKAQ